MVYLISFATWPSDKSGAMVKKAIEIIKKFPPDESLGEDLTPGNAIKVTIEGAKTISITNVSEGKLKEAYLRAQAIANSYAMVVAGFEYNIEVWSNDNEAYGSIGQKPPE